MHGINWLVRLRFAAADNLGSNSDIEFLDDMMTSSANGFLEIIQAFQNSEGVAVLSLDCFDTLFWRYLSTPADIFCEISPEIGLRERTIAESRARFRQQLQGNAPEVDLADIYEEVLQGAPKVGRIEHFAECEVQAEIRNGLVFQPAIALLRLAKQRGVRTIVVSDTYFHEPELRKMLQAHAPDINDLLDKIYCSCEYGAGKTTGLWERVLKLEKIKPRQVFHVGDNVEADYRSPVKYGIDAHWFEQQVEAVRNFLGSRIMASRIMFPGRGPVSLFHPVHSIHSRQIHQDEKLAYLTLGPIMACFAGFIRSEVERLGAEKTKVAFLMRDGYLPKKAYEALTGEQCSSLRISRFTTLASSFFSKKSILDYLVEYEGTATEAVMLRQLLLPPATKQKILASLAGVKGDARKKALTRMLMSDRISGLIISNSARFRQRLLAHIEREVGVAAGENLLLVDLGYTGTTLRLLRSAIAQQFDCQVHACYLIATGAKHQEGHVRGLMNPDNVGGFGGVLTLVRFIASLEMLCCSSDGSTLDYTETGEAILDSAQRRMGEAVRQRLEQIQEGAVRFVEASRPTIGEVIGRDNGLGMLASEAATDLCRFVYFPEMHEIELLESISFDVNMGFDIELSLVDRQGALQTMREQGVFMPLLNNTETQRMGYAAEVRHAGIEFSIALMSIYKNDYSFNASAIKNSLRTVAIDVLFVGNDGAHARPIQAFATFDGYYVMVAPPGGGELAVMFGKSSGLVEINAVRRVPITDLYKPDADFARDLVDGVDYFYSDASLVDGNIINFAESGFMYFPRSSGGAKDAVVIVFRQLSPRRVEIAK